MPKHPQSAVARGHDDLVVGAGILRRERRRDVHDDVCSSDGVRPAVIGRQIGIGELDVSGCRLANIVGALRSADRGTDPVALRQKLIDEVAAHISGGAGHQDRCAH